MRNSEQQTLDAAGVAPRPRHPSRMRQFLLPVVSLAALAALGGCSAGSASTAAPSPTSSPTAATPTPSSPDVHSAPGEAVVNLPVTSALRTELLSAAAQFKHVPAADYSGLAKGGTYYAYDPATRSYWAGAGLIPKPDSTAAGVSVNDNGAYDVFIKSNGDPWRVYDVGLAGGSGSSTSRCPVTIPTAVLHVWNWPAGACHPAPIR